MTLRINESFEGPVGVALDTTNTTASLYLGAGSSVFEAAHIAAGTSSGKFTTAAGLRQAQWGSVAASNGYFSFYVSPSAVPGSNVTLLLLGTTSTIGSTVCAVVYMAGTGKMKLGNATYVTQGTVTTDSLVVNELNRVDLSYVAGALTMAVYPGNAQAGNAAGTATAGNSQTGTTTVTTYSYRSLGHGGPNSTFTSNFDAFREDDTALPGPVVVAMPTSLTGAALETDTVAAALVSLSAAVPLTAALLEGDTLAAVLRSATALVGALLESDTVGAALVAVTAGLTATVALVPSSGVIPFTVTATCTATGGATAKTYAWVWGDGATTPAGTSASATHLVTSSGLYTVACTVTAGASSTVGLAGASVETDVVSGVLVSLAAGGITHGQQMNASNTGIAYAGLTVGQLTTAGSTTYSTAGQVITNMRFTGPVVLNAANITLRNCQVEVTGSTTQAIQVNAGGALIENCTITVPGAASAYMGIHMSGTNLTVRRCDISKFENNMTIEGGPTLVEYSYLHDSSNVSNPTGHRDCCEIYGGDDVTLRMNRMVHPAGETSVINIAPWYGANNVRRCTVQDCFLDGGNMITLVDLQSTGVINYARFLRNKLGGHTDPAVIGRYAALNNADGRAIVGTAAAQTADPNAILWPTSGADASYWDECADLVPNRTGQIVLPP